MALIHTYLSIGTLNVTIKYSNQKAKNDWKDKKQDLTTWAYKRFIAALRIHTVSKWKWKKIFYASGNQKRAGVGSYTYIRQNKSLSHEL